MPRAPKKTLSANYEEIPGKATRVICLTCRAAHGGEQQVARRNYKAHEMSGKHITAVEIANRAEHRPLTVAGLDNSESEALGNTDTDMLDEDDRSTAVLDAPCNLMPREHILPSIMGQETEKSLRQQFLDSLDKNEGEAFFEDDGEQIQFSAGTTELGAARQIAEQLNTMDLFPHRAFSGSVFDASSFANHEHEDDSVTPDIYTYLQALHMDDSDYNSDDELGGGEAFPASLDDADSPTLWEPYQSKTMFMIDLLDSLPRLRLSDDQMKTIMWVMKLCGTRNVPSLPALRKVQEKLTSELGINPGRKVSALGNEFYAISPEQTFRLDWANPLVRSHIRPFVEISSSIGEFYQAKRLVDASDDATLDSLQLMWADFEMAPERHFYIKEVARLYSGQLVIPLKWICQVGNEGNESYGAEVLEIAQDIETNLYRIHGQSIHINAKDLAENYLDLKAEGCTFLFDPSSPPWTAHMPHPVRKQARNRPTFTLGIMTWADDVSGNRTKQYNPHTNVYTANTNLPHRKRQQEYFVRFCSTSPTASALEQLDPLMKAAQRDQWYPAYDCLLEREILFRIISRLEPADNPQQSELCSHIGPNGNLYCRRCNVGGPEKELEKEGQYESLYTAGPPRTTGATLQAIRDQFDVAALGIESNVTDLQTTTGTKDKIAQHWITRLLERGRQLRYQYLTDPKTRDPRLNLTKKNISLLAKQEIREKICDNIVREQHEWLCQQPPHRFQELPENSILRTQLRAGDHYNILLGCEDIDVHRDTPVEMLHTYLLGQDKYVWYRSHSSWSNAQLDLVACRLDSTSVEGLSVYPLRGQYLVQFRGNLVGKQFKALQQVMLFHLHGDLYDSELFKLWDATGRLGAVLWCDSITDMDTYLADVDILIANVLDIWGEIDPKRIIQKSKLHTLAHTVQDVENFGPTPLYSTEIFECWNAIFRLCSVLSNHHSPSRDIAESLARLERFKHQVSGGWWKNKDGHYTRAGQGVRMFLESHPELQRRLGWASETARPAGSVKVHPRTTRTEIQDGTQQKIRVLPQRWADILLAAKVPNLPEPLAHRPPSEAVVQLWFKGMHVVAQSGDVCRQGTWVFYRGGGNLVLTGRVSTILIPTTDARKLKSLTVIAGTKVVVEEFDLASKNDPFFNMPVLTPSAKSEPFTLIVPSDILFMFNAQHDCHTAECQAEDVEEPPLARKRKVVMHGPRRRYIVNLHAIHNAALIRRTLPRNLTEPTLIFPDRVAKHREYSALLQVSGPAKRAETQAKAAQTRARNKATGVGEASADANISNGNAAAAPLPS